jgi:pyruvate dehydrogenase E1 component alpha subunit
MMAELYGTSEGYGRGVGGSMHIADLEKGIFGANGIVGAGILIATGAALAFQVQETDRVATVFFGEGAINGGGFFESLNLAALWHLPIVYVCENNGFAEMTPQSVHIAGDGATARANSFGIQAKVVDGVDALAVHDTTASSVATCRAGRGPVLIEAKTNRWRGHFEGDQQRYREQQELAAALGRDPIQLLETRILAEGWADAQWVAKARLDAEREMHEAADRGSEGHPIDLDALLAQVYIGS